MLFDRILVPLDGSETAEAILVHLSRLLRRKESEVVLVQAVIVPAMVGMDVGPLIGDLRTDAEKYILALVEDLKREGVRARGVTRVGGAAEVILETAAATHATLIAMATHGLTGLPRFFLGSVAEKILRSSPVPVLVVRSFEQKGKAPERTPHRQLPFNNVLFPVDGSDNSLRILPEVREFAKVHGSAVMVLGVVESEGGKSYHEPLIRQATKKLAEAEIPVDPVVRIGDPASEILDAAKRHGADLIAMSTHGRSGPSRWVLGSITEKVLRHAEVPMLVVRPAAKE